MSAKERRKAPDNQVFHIKIGPNAEVTSLSHRNLMLKTLRFSKYLNKSMLRGIWKIWELKLIKRIFIKF